MVGYRRRRRLEQYRLRDLVAALGKAQDDDRVKAVALDLDGFIGGGQTAIGDLADAVRAVRASGKPVVAYGVGYTDDSYQLAVRGFRDLAQSARRGADRRPGRIEPLFQGPARQARGDRQRLSRRHLQVGGRAVHPQRHVARGPAELRGARPGDARKLAPERQAGAAQGQCRPLPQGHERRGRRGRRRHGQSGARRGPGRQDRRPHARSRLGSPQLGGKETQRRQRGFSRIKLGSYVDDVVDRSRPGRSAWSPSPA